ncbi:tyrosine-type recombinase/integrase [Vibrio anguillarum]|uniref:tyrosine-type recombinase/integrase n=1 Tax=Vibrio anguillarum TaxID=55601 RepID=UPI00097E382C|nr:site-specific integrase [Vibrio anguillarum]MBT2909656.1 tyrosine-type recombinase/integrase [Vibrio anguillarum]MBT2942493.1 tyrosine-type recombinase/integrase [Vibrio anguillarum]MBT2950683.1 tyrosine-type recombinase/integrase [Vibrio anguillarum]MBT2979418.1 tyrosine-type recombinase/integrase [Vibrio anguillarum]
MRTVTVSFSESSIKQALENAEGCEIKVSKRPTVLLRPHKGLKTASWWLRKGQKYHPLGQYPMVSVAMVKKRLPSMVFELSINPEAKVVEIGSFSCVSELLSWYCERAMSNSKMSDKRKATVKSVVNKHLIPMLGDKLIDDVNHACIDDLLIWPLQCKYSLSNVRLIFSCLKAAFKTAAKQRRIEKNPLAELLFSDFIQKRILPKDAQIRTSDMPAVFAVLVDCHYCTRMLILLMLLYGTRIGETRQAKWANIYNDFWHIPAAHTKTKQGHRLPLTDLAKSLLAQHRERQKKSGYTGKFLFPNPDRSGDCISPSKASEDVRDVSSGEWTAHDLRKVARSAWADLGVDYMVAEMLLNHALSKLDQTYIHTHVEHKKKEALDIYHAWLKERGFPD